MGIAGVARRSAARLERYGEMIPPAMWSGCWWFLLVDDYYKWLMMVFIIIYSNLVGGAMCPS